MIYNDNTLYVICECAINPADIKIDILNESSIELSDGTKVPYVTIDATLQSFEVKNWNQRIYGSDVVMESIDNDGMIQNDIKRGQWCGEYGHPLDLEPRRQMIIFPQTASHRILSYRKEANLLKAHVQTLAGGCGPMMAMSCLQGVPAAFSLRSLGSIDMATHRVKSPLKVITYDSVFRPSHIEAYQEKILTESANLFIPKSNTIEDLITESAIFNPITETIDQMNRYAKNKSNNVSLIADLFHLHDIDCTLNESCTRFNVKIDDNNMASVPIDTMIKLQYGDILSQISKTKRIGNDYD